ncbi:MAG: GntR family transcriptional regulator [Pseudomonadota bacterium]
MALKSVRTERTRLADAVYDEILDAIIKGDIGADDRLVQERLAAELQISRTPVREALLRLEQDGILVTSARGGFKLHRLSAPEIKELYQARAAIEGQAIRILAVARDEADLETLRRTIIREEDIQSKTVANYFDANRAIHRQLVALAGNRYLLEMFDMIWNRAVAYQLFAAIEKVDLSKSLGDHMALADAVATGDATVAMDAIVAHIVDGYQLQLEALDMVE